MFTKIAAPVVGPIDLVTSRLIIAAAFLAPIFLRKRHFQGFRNQLKPLIIFGIFNATLPFFLFAYAALALNAGTLSVMNATSPLFAFVISIRRQRQMCIRDSDPYNKTTAYTSCLSGYF